MWGVDTIATYSNPWRRRARRNPVVYDENWGWYDTSARAPRRRTRPARPAGVRAPRRSFRAPYSSEYDLPVYGSEESYLYPRVPRARRRRVKASPAKKRSEKAMARRRKARRNPRRRYTKRNPVRRLGRRRVARRRSRRNPAVYDEQSGLTYNVGKKKMKKLGSHTVLAGQGKRRGRKGKSKGNARRAGSLTKRQRAARKAAATRKRNKARRSAAARKAARTRRYGRRAAPKSRSRKGRKGRKARRSPKRSRRYGRRVAPRRTIPKRGKRNKARRRLSSRYRGWYRHSRVGRKLRKSLSRHGRRYRRGKINKAQWQKGVRRRMRRRAVRSGLRGAYRRARVTRTWRKQGHKRWGHLKGIRNPFTLGGMKDIAITAGTAFLGWKGAKVLSAFLVDKLLASKLGTNPTVARIISVGGGVVPPLAIGFGLLFAKKKVAKLNQGMVGKVIDALVFGAFVAAVEKLVVTYALPALAKSSPKLAEYLAGTDLLDASGYPITREWGRYAPIQGYAQDYSPPVPGIGHYAAVGEGLIEAPAGMGLMEAPAGMGAYIPQAGGHEVGGLGGLGAYVQVAQGGLGTFNCPSCGAQGEAPAGSNAARCWSCQQVVSGIGATDMSVVGPMSTPTGIFSESIFGTGPAAR